MEYSLNLKNQTQGNSSIYIEARVQYLKCVTLPLIMFFPWVKFQFVSFYRTAIIADYNIALYKKIYGQ